MIVAKTGLKLGHCAKLRRPLPISLREDGGEPPRGPAAGPAGRTPRIAHALAGVPPPIRESAPLGSQS